MQLSRRDFLSYCGASAVGLGFNNSLLGQLTTLLTSTASPKVIWMQGASCSGCSISFLNRIATTAPKTAADVLIQTINLAYHPTLMAEAGQGALGVAEQAITEGGYFLVVEGAVPTRFGGATCFAWTDRSDSMRGRDVTFVEAVRRLAARARGVVCAGTCSAFGGIPAAGGNPTTVASVQSATGVPTINVPGCPTHPDWLVWVLANLIAGTTIALDSSRRPTALFGTRVHSRCPRRGASETSQFGTDGCCLEELGCRGPSTYAPCPTTLWNGQTNWCIGANAPCYGCTQPNFPQSPLWVPGD